MKSFSIIVAMDEKNGIGKNGDLAWRLPADLKHFKEITTKATDSNKKNAVIMGRKTWDSLPEKFKPLPGRLNIVLSRNLAAVVDLAGTLGYADLEGAVKAIDSMKDLEEIFVIGGAQVFNETINHSACQTLYVTQIKGDFSCDTFFPPIPASFQLTKSTPWSRENNLDYRFCQYEK